MPSCGILGNEKKIVRSFEVCDAGLRADPDSWGEIAGQHSHSGLRDPSRITQFAQQVPLQRCAMRPRNHRLLGCGFSLIGAIISFEWSWV